MKPQGLHRASLYSSFLKPHPLYRGFVKPQCQGEFQSCRGLWEATPVSAGKNKICLCLYEAHRGFANPLKLLKLCRVPWSIGALQNTLKHEGLCKTPWNTRALQKSYEALCLGALQSLLKSLVHGLWEVSWNTGLHKDPSWRGLQSLSPWSYAKSLPEGLNETSLSFSETLGLQKGFWSTRNS